VALPRATLRTVAHETDSVRTISFNRQMPLEKSTSYFAYLVHADHPHKPLPATQAAEKEIDGVAA
jgi:hypothetical protein